MSVDPDKSAACPRDDTEVDCGVAESTGPQETKTKRSVRFPSDNNLVTKYFEPANPWQDVAATSRAQLAQEYLLSCRKHNTAPIDSVLHQIRELPENCIGGGGGVRAARLTLADCSLEGAAPADALEALLKKVQFRRLELDHADVNDEGAEALFDMIEYYESAIVISVTGPRQFGIRGWQAASRMIKKSAELSEIEVSEGALEVSHAPVLSRALRPHTCRLRALCLQRAALSGEALMCLVIALKSNASIRELRLPDNSLTPHDAQQLASLLRFNNNIQLLDLSNNQIQDLGVGHLADSLVDQAAQTPPSAATSPLSPQLYPLSGSDARGLAFLVLWNNQLTRNCAPHLTKALRSSHSLCVLNIGRNALGCDTIRSLATGAALTGPLLSLGLQSARLGPEAGAPLRHLLTDTKLQRLDLRDNRLSAASLQALLGAARENHTLTQIDLDDPVETTTLSADSEAAACVARLTRDVRAACRRNEPTAPPPSHRRISLTCHEPSHNKSGPGGAGRSARLRSPLPSPAPSPAGSPVPHHHHNVQVNRFQVTRVTPERELCSDGGTPARPYMCTPPSRFKVMQVAEPPQIQVHPAKISSRFSVTRNYDSCYNISPSCSPSPSPTPSVSPTMLTDSPTRLTNSPTPPTYSPTRLTNSPTPPTYSPTRLTNSPTPPTYSPTPSISPCPSDTKSDDSMGITVQTPYAPSHPTVSTSNVPRQFPRYDTPSITTLSGALFSRSVPEMSTTTLCPTRSCSNPIELSPCINTSSSSLDISRSSDIDVTPVAIPNSRFSISPSPVSFISPIEDIHRPKEDLNYIYRSQNIRKDYTEISEISKSDENICDVNRSQSNVCDLYEPPVVQCDIILPSYTGAIELPGVIEDVCTVKSKDDKTPKTDKKFEMVVEKRPEIGHCIDVHSEKETDISVLESIPKIRDISTDIESHKPFESVCAQRCEFNKNSNETFESNVTSKIGGAITIDAISSSDAKDISEEKDGSDVKSIKSLDKTYSSVVKCDPYKDKSEQLIHEEQIGDDRIKTETKLVKNSVVLSECDKLDVQVEVTVKTESVADHAAKVHSDKDFANIDDILINKDDKALKKIEAITEDLGNLIKQMKEVRESPPRKVEISSVTDIVPVIYNRDIVLKKNKSESSLDSPDLEVSRLMNKKGGSPFRDSSSSLEISGSSMESLNAVEKPSVIAECVNETELDRRKVDNVLMTESSVESSSDVTPVNSGNFLNMSVSSNESVSPIIFGKSKKIHGSLSSLEASVSSLDSKHDKIMVTSADSGIEHSLQQPESTDASSNEGTLTQNSSLKDTVKVQETLTSSPKRTSSLLDVPLKSKGLERMRKISWVAPSPSFHIPRPEPEKVREEKPSHLEKLLSLFQHPTSLFSRSQSDDERKSASNTPPRKDSSLTSSFWTWGSAIEKEKEDKEDSSEATDSTLSERVQVSFVDESFSKKLDSKTPSTDTDNTLSEFQSFSQNPESEKAEDLDKNPEIGVTDTTDDLVQKCLDLSLNDAAGDKPNSDTIDLNKPNDLKETDMDKVLEVRLDPVRPRSFAAVLKASGSENSLEKQPSPDAGQVVNKLPVKVIRGIKENISPENTVTASITNTQALAIELKHQPIVNALWDITIPSIDKTDDKTSDLAPIATIDETCDLAADNDIQLDFIDDVKPDDQNEPSTSQLVTSGNVDLGKDALSYLIYENQDFEPGIEHAVASKVEEGSLAQELKDAAIKEMIDLSPELVIDEAIEVIPAKDTKIQSPVTAKVKSNSLEDLTVQEKEKNSPKTKTIAFKVPETSPRDIPERRSKLRSRSGSSPKSLPESLNKPCPLSKMDSILSKKKKKVSTLGKIARDSLLALNMSEDEIAEFRRSYKLTSVESLRSLESVSEDANSQSGTSFDSRCRACLRTSQESLMSLDSITEDCKCEESHQKPSRSAR